MNILMILKPKSEVEYLIDTCTVRQGLEKMRAHAYMAIPVITKDGLYAGSVSEGDFLWHLVDRSGEIDSIRKCENYRIREIMKTDRNPAVTVDVEMSTVLERATHQNFIPVTSSGLSPGRTSSAGSVRPSRKPPLCRPHSVHISKTKQ